MECVGSTHRKRVEALLASCVPNLITKHAVLKAALLSEESSANCGLLVCLEVVRHLNTYDVSTIPLLTANMNERTKRRTTEDLPTAASPDVKKVSVYGCAS